MGLCRAKYRATCFRCGTPILEGQMIDFTRGYSSRTRHAACQTDEERKIAPYDHEQQRYVSPEKLGLPADSFVAELQADAQKRWVRKRVG